MLLWGMCLFCGMELHAQEVLVANKEGNPIPDVLISSGEKTAFSNQLGIADLSVFNNEDVLVLTHQSYLKKVLTKQEALSFRTAVIMFHDLKALDDMTVRGRWEIEDGESPIDLVKVNPRKYHLEPNQTAADLLGSTREVFIQKSQYGGGSPMIRGFSANRILIVVDGVRMNNAIFRGGNLQNIISVDPNSIDDGEVILGPGSLMYGSDALGGVIDFHSLKPKYYSEDSTRVTGSAMLRTASASSEISIHGDINYHGDKASFISSFTQSNFGDLRMGSKGPDDYLINQYVGSVFGKDSVLTNPDNRTQIGSGYSQINLLNKVRFRPDSAWDMTYAFHFSETSDIPRYDRLIQTKNGEPRYAEWYYGPQKWQLHAVNLIHEADRKLLDKMVVNFGFQKFEESRNDRDIYATTERQRTERVNAFNLGVDLEKALKDSSTIYYGVEHVNNHVRSLAWRASTETGNTVGIASRYPDNSNWVSNSVYIGYRRKLGTKVSMLGGIRYNQILLNAVFDTAFYQFPFEEIRSNTGALSGSLGAAWRVSRLWKFNLNFASGFRAPNIDDMAKVFDSEPGNVLVPNPDLRPEYAYTAEIGFNYTDKDIARVDFGGFYTILDNALIRGDYSFNGQDSIMYDGTLSKVEALTNADGAVIYGASIAGKWNLVSKLWLKGAVTWQDGQDSKGDPLRHVAPFFANTHLSYETPRWKVDASMRFNGSRSYDQLAPSEKNKPHLYAMDEQGRPYSPSWYTLNLAGSYAFSGVLVSLGVENILDARYRTYSSGITAAGRNFFGSVSYQF